jgi:hypothetical protein
MHEDIYNLHIVAPPICGSLTGKYMSNVNSEVLGGLDPCWRTKFICATSDGAVIMVGSVRGWQTRLRNADADPESFYIVHCGA